MATTTRRPASAASGQQQSTYGTMEVTTPYRSLPDHEATRTSAAAAPPRHTPKPSSCCGGVTKEQWLKGIIYGLINASICLPASISFATIIFRHAAFAPFLPSLVRLVLLSSAVHAIIFVSFSSMPFAVGQVQDAGLIFLSSMASTIADYCQERQHSEAVLLSTTLVLLSLSTALVGVSLIIMGRLKLASTVTYIPMAAVSGYLAFIGLFAFNAGLSFMTETQLDSVAAWRHLGTATSIAKLAPGLVLGVGMFVLLRYVHHVLTLPGTLAFSVVAFYAVLLGLGFDLDQARALGWVAPPVPPTPFYEAWKLFNFRLVQWEAVPLILPSWVALTLVVAFSSSLDVAAIEMEVKRPLLYNHELIVIGVANVASGLTGGFTGSYIFSQTIFNLRRGIDSRVCSTVIALVELVAFLAPVSLIAYVPRFFFGGLLVLIGTDLMLEWLWMSRKKMMPPEYAVTLATFVAIQLTNIELGMGIGILLAVVAFAFSYAEAPLVLHPRVRHSSVVRTFEERAILNSNMDKVVTLGLRGYIFFGSAVKILNEIKENVLAGHISTLPTPEEQAEEEEAQRRKPDDQSMPIPFSPASSAAILRSNGEAGSSKGGAMHASSAPTTSANPLLTRVKSAPRLVPPFTSITGDAQQTQAQRAHLLTSSMGGARGGGSGSGAGGNSLLLLSGRSLGGGDGGSGASSVRDVLTPVYHRGGVWVEAAAGAASATGSSLSRGRSNVEEEDEEEENGDADERRSAFGGERANGDESLDRVPSMDNDDDDDDVAPLFSRTHSRSSQNRSSSVYTGTGTSYDTAAEFLDAMDGGLSPLRGPSPLGDGGRASPPRRLASAGSSDEEAEEHEKKSTLLDFYLSEWSGVEGAVSSARGGGTVAPVAAGPTVPQNRIRWLVFDFSQVVGIDATAARSCFLMLKSLLHSAHIRVVFASLVPKLERLLRGHGVIDDDDPVFASVDEALEYSEEELLQSAAELSDNDLLGLSRHPSFYATVRRSRRLSRRAPSGTRRDRLLLEAQEALDLESILADYLEVPLEEEHDGAAAEGGGGMGKESHFLAQYFEEAVFEAGQCLFQGGEASDKLYFIRKGVVELQLPADNTTATGEGRAGGRLKLQRLQKVSAGGSVGELGFFLRRPQIFTAVATTRCRVYYMTRPNLLALAKAHPELACVLTFAVIKSIALASSYAISDFADLTLLLKYRKQEERAGE